MQENLNNSVLFGIQGRYAEAEPLFRLALQVSQVSLGEGIRRHKLLLKILALFAKSSEERQRVKGLQP
ncbi:MAG: hypothetical protein R2880_16295 [Deinococcales bacterium]